MALNKKHIALTIGCFLAVVHAVWALLIAIMKEPLQNFLDWMFKIHFMQPYWVLTQFKLLDAIWLVIATFIAGYIFGWVFAAIWNWAGKKK